jgi:hypothetical protein
MERIERRLQKTAHKKRFSNRLGRFLKSKTALAIPVTYLILFVSLIAVISATYSYAVVKISGRGAVLKASVAKQNMQVLDDAVRSGTWSYGASRIVYMDDCGGIFQTFPTAKKLVLNITDGQPFYDIVFNSSLGKAFYELEASAEDYDGLFVRGDYRAIVNQSAFTMTQLYFSAGNQAKELTLSFRPSATVATIGTSNGKPLNLVRVYVINLNSSQNLMLTQAFYLKATTSSVTTLTRQYEFNASVSSLSLKAVLDGTSTTVQLPISSNPAGAAVTLEIVLSNITVQRMEV